MWVYAEEEEIGTEIERKSTGIERIGVENIYELRKIIMESRNVFRKGRGRIYSCEHEFKVRDKIIIFTCMARFLGVTKRG